MASQIRVKILKSLCIISTMIFLITGCSSISSVNNINFSGESENWKVTQKFKIDDSNSTVEKSLSIENKDTKDKIDTINFTLYKDGDETQKGTGIPLVDNKYVNKAKNEGVSSPTKESKYVIEIEWNNQEETISLNNTN